MEELGFRDFESPSQSWNVRSSIPLNFVDDGCC
jgi:hypothetical protein